MEYVHETESTIKQIFNRIKRKDFSGDAGHAVKNSLYQFSTNIIAKVGSLIFTIILARMLLPELFGLYSLALSTILIFVTFSNLGIWRTLIRFVSRQVGKGNPEKAKSYFIYLTKLKIFLIFIVIVALAISAKFISENYFQKPLFLAFIAGLLYILFIGLNGLFTRSFQAISKFGTVVAGESIFQVARIILVPLFVFFSLKSALSDGVILFYVILALALSYLISLLFLLLNSKKLYFLKEKTTPLREREKKGIKKFILALSVTIIFGAFLSHIDTIMLGRFVAVEFIGYYSAALNIMMASVALITFSTALLPVFSGLKRKKLDDFYRKSVEIILTISVLVAIFYFFLAPYIIKIVFGQEYLASIKILRIFSVLLILLPMIGLLTTYLTSIGKPQLIVKWLVLATIINVVLNYVLISWLISYGQVFAIYGAVAATILSNAFFLVGLLISKRRKT